MNAVVWAQAVESWELRVESNTRATQAAREAPPTRPKAAAPQRTAQRSVLNIENKTTRVVLMTRIRAFSLLILTFPPVSKSYYGLNLSCLSSTVKPPILSSFCLLLSHFCFSLSRRSFAQADAPHFHLRSLLPALRSPLPSARSHLQSSLLAPCSPLPTTVGLSPIGNQGKQIPSDYRIARQAGLPPVQW